jgi:hypothetical protein
MIVELHNDDGTKTTYFGVSDFNRHDARLVRVTTLFLNNRIDVDYEDREFVHKDAQIRSVITESVNNRQALIEHFGDRLVEPGHEIIVGIPSISAKIAYALAELRRDPEIDAEDNLTIVGQPDPEFPPNDTSEVDD